MLIDAKYLSGLFILIFVFSKDVFAEDIEVSGVYLRDGGAEYESAFLPCGKDEIWWIENGDAYDDLVETYRAITTKIFQEVFVKLSLSYEPIDMEKYPNSHYQGSAKVYDFSAISSYKKYIDECAEGNLNPHIKTYQCQEHDHILSIEERGFEHVNHNVYLDQYTLIQELYDGMWFIEKVTCTEKGYLLIASHTQYGESDQQGFNLNITNNKTYNIVRSK